MKILVLVFLAVWCRADDDVIEREFVSVRSLHRRGIDSEQKEIQLEAFGRNYHLLLKRADVFAPEFTMVTVSHTASGETVLETRQIQDDPDNDIFSEVDGPASLHINDKDQLKVEGVLDENINIRPLNDKETEFEWDHVIERRNNKREMVKDYIYMNETRENPPNEPQQGTRRDKRQSSSAVVVEVLPVLDYPNSQNLGQNIDKIKRYIGITYNNVNNRFSVAKDPTVRVALTGVVTFKNVRDQTFINSNLYEDKDKIKDQVLYSFKDWMKSNKTALPKYDVTMLHLSYDAGSYDENGKWNGGLAGLAFVGTACDTNNYNSAFSEDTAPYYTGVETVAHELGHSLNLPHDGDGDASSCSPSDGYIMGQGFRLAFSSCSLSILRSFAKSTKAKCLTDGSGNKDYPLINEFPGLRVDPDLQCKSRFGDDYIARYLFDSGNCEKLWCGKDARSLIAIGPALEGTTCGYNKVCLESKCSTNPIKTGLQQCKSFSTAYVGSNENDSTFCKALKCRRSNGQYDSKGVPLDGTVCGNGGRCIDKVCAGEVPSANSQCERLFGKSTANDQPPPYCDTLWCKTSDGKTRSYGGAFPSTKCGDGQFCDGDKCVKR